MLLENLKGRRVREGDVEVTLAFKFSGETACSGTTTSCSDKDGAGVLGGSGCTKLDQQAETRRKVPLADL